MQRFETMSDSNPSLDYSEWDSLVDISPVDESGIRTEDYEGSYFGQKEVEEEAKFDRLMDKLDRAAAEGRMSKEHVENLKARQLERSLEQIDETRRNFTGENLRYQAWLKEHDEENQENLKKRQKIEVEEVSSTADEPHKIEVSDNVATENHVEPAAELVGNAVGQTQNLELHPDVQAWLTQQIAEFTKKAVDEALEKQRQIEGQKLTSIFGAVAENLAESEPKNTEVESEPDLPGFTKLGETNDSEQTAKEATEEATEAEQEEVAEAKQEEVAEAEREEVVETEREEAARAEREEAAEKESLMEQITENQAEINRLKIQKLKLELAQKKAEYQATTEAVEDLENGKKPSVGLLAWLSSKIKSVSNPELYIPDSVDSDGAELMSDMNPLTEEKSREIEKLFNSLDDDTKQGLIDGRYQIGTAMTEWLKNRPNNVDE